MEFVEIPTSLGLDANEWSLLLGFFMFGEEPEARIPYLCQMEEETFRGLLPGLQSRGFVRSRKSGDETRFSLAPLEDWLLPSDAVDDADVHEMEVDLLKRIVETRGMPSITVIGTREARDPERLVPEVARFSTTMQPYIDLRLGTRCNLNCAYCLLGHEDRYERPINEIVADLSYAREQNLEKVSLTGGEPTLHSDLPRILKASKALGFRQILLVTNGITLSYPDRLERLVEAGVSAVGISFDTPDRDTAEAMWQSPVFDRVVAAFRSVAAHPDLPLGAIAVVTAMNYRQLPDLARFFVEVNEQSRNLFVPNLDFVMAEENAWLNRDRIVPRLTDVIGSVREALEYAHSKGLPLTYRGFPFCLLPGLDRYNYDRYMTIFRLIRGPDGGVFDRHSIDLLRTKAPGCRRCVHYRECTGVTRSYANLYGTDELEPVLGMP